MKDLANPYCNRCGGTGELNNGYFNHPCNCVRMKPLNIGEQPLIRDTYLKPIPKEIKNISPFGITELQYLRGLIMADKLVNDYETENREARISMNKSMHDFTEEILKKIDELEEC